MQGTAALFMDPAGDITGEYVDSNGIGHAFFRAAGGTMTSFDASGTGSNNSATVPIGIDSAGDVAGLYQDGNKVMHGFVRSAANGTVTVFSVSGAGTGRMQGTYPTSIDSAGDIAGIYSDSNGLTHGFLRSASGAVSTFDAITPNKNQGKADQGTDFANVNAAGIVVGTYNDASSVAHGYIRLANGTITTIDAPGAGTAANQGTVAYSIDAAGDVAGIYAGADEAVHGFVRSASGTFTSFDAPGAGTGTLQGTYPAQFDAAGDLAGLFIDTNNVVHGFVRAAGGAIATYSAPGASLPASAMKSGRLGKVAGKASSFYNPFGGHSRKTGSFLTRITGALSKMGPARSESNGSGPTGGIFNNTAGVVAGTFGLSVDAAGDVTGIYSDGDDVMHGFLRTANGSITTFAAPGAGTGALQGTGALSINAAGTIAGTYADENSVFHGFLLTLGQAATTTTLSPAPASSVYGEPVTLTAKVTSGSGTPQDGETIWFMNGIVALGSETLSGGSAILTTTILPGGVNSITAVYGGDTNFAGSSSAAVTETVAKASSTTKLISSLNPAGFGQFVTLTATVSGLYGGTATGTVTFKAGSATLGTASLIGGSAGLTTAALPLGNVALTAVYAGDTNFNGSMSTGLSQVVQQSTPAVTWATPASIPYGMALGTAQLNAIASVPGTFAYSPGPGTVPGIGSQTLKVTFTPADSAGYTTAKASVTLTVTAAAGITPTVSVHPSSTSITTVQALTVLATVNGGSGKPTPTGSVVLTSGSYTSDTMPLAGGAAEFGIPAGSLPVGSDTLTVTYTPDAASWATLTSAKGTSAPVTVSQGTLPGGTTTTLAVSSGGSPVTTVASGAVVTLTATVKAGTTPLTTGLVNFCDATAAFCTDIHLLGSAQLTSAGTASIKLRPAVGSHSYKAVFAGTKAHTSSTSASAALTLTGMNPVTTSIVETGTVGNYTLTATVSGQGSAAPTGTVSFLDTTYGDALLGSSVLQASGAGLNWLSSQAPTTGYYTDAVAVGDFNGDGIPDLAVTVENDPTGNVVILTGNGDGTFTAAKSSPATGYIPEAIVVGDFNGDGVSDLAVVNWCDSSNSCSKGSVTIMLGNGDSTFTQAAGSPVPVGSSARESIVTGDFNNDGVPDLAVVNSTDNSVSILLGQGNGQFVPAPGSPVATGSSPISAAVGDFNGDGFTDLAVANEGDSAVTILLGTGNGTFNAVVGPSTVFSPWFLTVADFNGDGILDLATADGWGGGMYTILLGVGDGTFAQPMTSSAGNYPASIAVADFNGDGIPDLGIADEADNSVNILLGNGDGTFTQPANSPVNTGTSPGSTAVGDFNGDGVPDLILTDSNSTAATVLLTIPQAASASINGISVSGHGPHLAVASYPGDSNYSAGVSGTAPLYAPTPAPVFSPAGGTYTSVQTVTLTDAAAGTTFYYTTDGSTPQTYSTKYIGPITISASEKIQAIAVANGYAASPVASASFKVTLLAVATPVFTPPAGVYATAQAVSITDATPGAAIYYTTNGSIPTTNSARYTGPISVTTSETLTAFAIAGGYSPSAEASAQYTMSSLPTSMIYTVAGDGILGYTGDYGSAIAANLYYPGGTAVDSAGNLYIADTENSCIRKVNAATGVITTVAGTGYSGYTGDNGPATSAELYYPESVAVDGAGNLYIADMVYSVIRRVDANTGIITTFAGNGTLGYLYNPYGVAVDGAGNVYIADSFDAVVEEVPANSGTMTVIAGNGNYDYKGDNGPATAAALMNPTGVAVDSAGNVYIADSDANVIRRVASGTGIITTVAGNGVGAFSGVPSYTGDGGPATSAELFYPESVAVDGAGNLYIADTANSVIRVVSAKTQIITTVAGNGIDCWGGDGGPATSAGVCYPAGVTVDSAGILYIADTSSNVVRKVLASGLPPVVPTAPPAFSIGSGSYSSAQVVTLSDSTPGAAIYITLDGTSPTSASYIYNGPVNVTGTVTLKAIAIAPGYLPSAAVSATYTFTIRPALVISTIAGTGINGMKGAGGPATSAQIGDPYGLARDGAGNLYFTDYIDMVVWRVDAKTGIITIVAGNGAGANTGIGGYSGDGGPATSAELNTPMGLAMDAGGNLYIADYMNHRIRRVDATTGIITTYAGTGQPGYSGNGGLATAAKLNYPQGVLFDAAGNLLIADTSNRVVRKVDSTTGIITNVVGNHTNSFNGDGGLATSSGLSSPAQLAFDGAGNLYIEGGNRIRKVTAATGILTTVAGNGIAGLSGDGGPAINAEIMPRSIVVDGSGNILFGNIYGAIRMVSPAGIITSVVGNGYCSYSGDGGDPGVAGVCAPHAMVFDGAGNMYFEDSDNHVIRMVGPPPALITPVITWPTPAAIVYGTALSTTQLDATTTVAGNFVYNPQAGTVPNAGQQTLSVTFTPADATKYATATATTTLQVNQATPTDLLTTSASKAVPGSPVTLTATLTGAGVAPTGTVTFLNGTTSLGTGTLANGVATLTLTTLSVGSYNIAASYPGDSNYLAVTSSPVGVTVSNNPPPTVQLAVSANPVTYGTSVTFTLTATGNKSIPTGTATFFDGTTQIGTGPLDGTGAASYSTATLAAGTHTITANYPGDSSYGSVTSSSVSLVVNKATPTIQWATPSAITYGTALSTTQLNAQASVDGSMLYSPLPGAVLAAGSQSLSVAFTPKDTNDYTTASASVKLTVTPAVLTVTANGATRVYNAPNPAFTASITGFVNADAQSVVSGAPVLSTSATATSPVGSYPITPTLGTLSASNYSFTFVAGSLVITKATPAISWAQPAAIPYGTALSTTQLDATSPVAGTFKYSPAAGTVPGIGAQTLSATFTPTDTTDYNTATASVTLVVSAGAAKAALTSSASSIVYGASVTLTATVTGSGAAPTGSVIFLDGAVQLGTGALNSSGVATYSSTRLAVGSHSITASYTGDSNYAAATSSAVTVAVTKASQTITFTPVSTSVAYGASPITLVATATSGLAVTFSATGPATLNGNTLTITGVGSVVVTANQAGNGNYSAAPAVSQTIKVAKATPTAVLTSSEASGPYGASVTLTATLTGSGTGAPPTGTVTFQNGSTSLGTGTLNSSGVATLTLTTLPIGADSLKASYGGDSNYATATSTAITVTVNKSAQTINFPALASPEAYGVSPIKLTATASSGLAVSFSATGPATVSGSTLTITGVGLVAITASQTGNSNYAAATPVQQSITVTAGTPTVALKSSATSAAYGASVTFTATLTGGGVKPTGTVTFLNGSSSIGTGTLNSSGVATLAVTTLPVGANRITASYAGDSHYGAATSTAIAQTITQATPTVKLTASSSTPSFGAQVTLTATLTGATAGAKPTGTVTFLNGTTALGTGTVNSSGVAALVVSTLQVGKDSITASYGGDSNYGTATSVATAVTVGKASQTITFTPVPTSVTYGVASINLSATATSGLPVTFSATGPATVSGSTLTITGAGTVVVSANQAGNGNYSAAPAASQTIKVAKATPTDTLTASAATIASNASVTLTATLTGGATAPTGTVTFLDGKATLGTGKLSGGVATYSTTKLASGTHTITASFGGDTNYLTATSNPVTVTVSAH